MPNEAIAGEQSSGNRVALAKAVEPIRNRHERAEEQGGRSTETGAYTDIYEDFCYLPTQYGARAVDFG